MANDYSSKNVLETARRMSVMLEVRHRFPLGLITSMIRNVFRKTKQNEKRGSSMWAHRLYRIEEFGLLQEVKIFVAVRHWQAALGAFSTSFCFCLLNPFMTRVGLWVLFKGIWYIVDIFCCRCVFLLSKQKFWRTSEVIVVACLLN